MFENLNMGIFMVSHLLWERESDVSAREPVRSGKFILLFNLPYKRPPDNIDHLLIQGPAGYRFKISNQPFNYQNLNGYQYDPLFKIYFFSGIQPNPIPPGSYRIQVHYKNGKIAEGSNTLSPVPELQALWSKERKNFTDSMAFTPGGDRPSTLRWNPLKHPSLFYCARVSRGNHDFDYNTMVFCDNIYGIGRGNWFNSGKNKSSVNLPEKAFLDAPHQWFVEISDSNHLAKANFSVFSPSQSLGIRN